MKLLLSLASFLSLSIITFAQKTNKSKPNRYLYHTHGLSFQKFSNLNKRVTANPLYEPIKNNVATFQFGYIAERKKLSYNIGITIGSSFSGKKNTRSTNIRILEYSLDGAYNAFQKNRFSIAPFVGLALDNYTIKFNRDNSAVPFDSVVASTNLLQKTASLVFKNTFINYRAGINFTYKSVRKSGNAVGLQVGYAGGFSNNDWKINSIQALADSPKDALSKVFTHLVFTYQIHNNRR